MVSTRFLPRLLSKVFGRRRTITHNILDDRSSTASHYSSSFGKVTAGVEENYFYGIPLSTSIISDNKNTMDIYYLCILLLVLVLKPYYMKKKNNNLTYTEVSYWIGIGSVLYYLRDITLYPLLSNIIYTRTSYPYLIVIAHSISAVTSYRMAAEKKRSKTTNDNNNNNNNTQQEQQQQEEENTESSKDSESHIKSFGLAFFLYGFGGSILSDLLMGLPVTALAHSRILPCYAVSYLLVYFSPYDIIYSLMTMPTGESPLKLFVVTICETIDAVTTPMGRISRSARELQNKTTAPIMAGLFAGIGGSILRSTTTATNNIKVIEHGVYKTLSITLFWYYMVVWNCNNNDDEYNVNTNNNNCNTSYNGSDVLRVAIVGFHILWNILYQFNLTYNVTHPCIWIIENKLLYPLHKYIIPILSLGKKPTTTTTRPSITL